MITVASPTSRCCADQLGADLCRVSRSAAVAWFAARGIAVRRVMSDNGSGYVSRRLSRHVRGARAPPSADAAYTPRTNGKAERFIQTLLREWAYAEPYATSRSVAQTLRPYLQYYNRQRPHASLDYQAPWSRLTSAA